MPFNGFNIESLSCPNAQGEKLPSFTIIFRVLFEAYKHLVCLNFDLRYRLAISDIAHELLLRFFSLILERVTRPLPEDVMELY